MTDDDPIDALLRRNTPPVIEDDGFTARTMHALPKPGAARIASARSLELEQRRYAAQSRHWRWATVGVLAGTLAAAGIVLVSPGELVVRLDPSPGPAQWLPLSLVLAAGSLWYAWRTIRAA
jgi:hypothetical protein